MVKGMDSDERMWTDGMETNEITMFKNLSCPIKLFFFHRIKADFPLSLGKELT